MEHCTSNGMLMIPHIECLAPGDAGVPTYAVTWTLANPGDFSEGAATTGAGNAGPYTGTAGILSYYEVLHDPQCHGCFMT